MMSDIVLYIKKKEDTPKDTLEYPKPRNEDAVKKNYSSFYKKKLEQIDRNKTLFFADDWSEEDTEDSFVLAAENKRMRFDEILNPVTIKPTTELRNHPQETNTVKKNSEKALENKE
ncbi:hypothetical protein AYI69_g262 [Smittium culicis]|uniref:Uncharacterized protein n=1 Tax=Smittium culicis TaxID=133412 RepID=A0A1R1YTI3_9FUNG|nr:hypothetical protein AYI69_g262 [Smittium culicis]